MSPAVEARRLLRGCRSGALATLSTRLNGHPFASAVPFMADYDASPILLISRLAEHTKNIACDARVSLMVHEPNADPQVAPRLTIAGHCRRIEAPASMRNRYIRYFPAAADLLALDFDFHRIAPTAIRYIGGLGKIHWLATPAFSDAGGIDARLEHEWLARLERSASDAGADTRRVVGIDCDGIDIAHDGLVRRCAFAESVTQPEALATAIRALLDRATE